MANDEEPPKDYEVGYGKPPRHTRFKKGQSGNPSGKRKRDETFRDKLRRLAGEEVVVRQNGALVTMTREDAIANSVLMKSMNGDLRAVTFFTDQLGHDPGVETPPEFKITEADIAMLETAADWRELVERARAEMNADNDDREPEGDHFDDDAFEDF